jgi:hypothetical protein
VEECLIFAFQGFGVETVVPQKLRGGIRGLGLVGSEDSQGPAVRQRQKPQYLLCSELPALCRGKAGVMEFFGVRHKRKTEGGENNPGRAG